MYCTYTLLLCDVHFHHDNTACYRQQKNYYILYIAIHYLSATTQGNGRVNDYKLCKYNYRYIHSIHMYKYILNI